MNSSLDKPLSRYLLWLPFPFTFICEKGVQSTEVWRIRDLAQALLESFSPKKDEERGKATAFFSAVEAMLQENGEST